ncbi:unnamed protein product, partial [Effrenium voratum]
VDMAERLPTSSIYAADEVLEAGTRAWRAPGLFVTAYQRWEQDPGMRRDYEEVHAA